MRVLIFGSSSHTSIGAEIRDVLRREVPGTTTHCVSRSCAITWDDCQCDVTNLAQVVKLCTRLQPYALIHAAGSFIPLARFRHEGTEEERVAAERDHLLAKSVGALNVVTAAHKVSSVKRVVFLGGRALSTNQYFGSYTVANAALWAATKFATRHYRQFTTNLIDLPLVRGTPMARKLGYTGDDTPIGSVDGKQVGQIVRKLLVEAKYAPGSRIILGRRWTE
jgi:hypothetical protein